ncbi:hypothetical protein BDV93DRAFT_559058 [Ceratobasidium sp. AG-I]|nr:hypothetical protein BDV93DRAFT_559058 [Ceratobasidium sp. AG-I]
MSLELERNGENSVNPQSYVPPFPGSDSSLPCLSEWFTQEPIAIAGSSSAKPLVWADSKPKKNAQVARVEQEEQERGDPAQPEERAREEREQEEKEHEEKRWEEKLAEIKLKIEEEQVEVRRVAEVAARRGEESITHESEERWETVVRRRNGRGPNQNSRGSGGNGRGGSRAPRRA